MTGLFLDVLNLSISAGWLILAVLVLRLALKKAPKWVNVLLWGMVAVRLLCPFSIESALSLIPSAETFPQQVISGPSFDVQTGISPVDDRINDYLGDRYFEGVTVPAHNGYNVMAVLTILWIIGIAAMALYTAVSYWRLRRKVDTAIILRDNIFRSEQVSSPFVLGILSPRIYLPLHMREQDLAHVIAHERAHIRRRDHWWKPLGFALLTIHWFNPLMWVAYTLLCRDIELACDEKVIRELSSEQRADYTQALITASVNRKLIAACPLAFGEVGVKERVRSVMNYRKPTFWIVITATVACAAVAVCFLTDPKPAPEFAMRGTNVSDIDPEGVVERIVRFQGIENSSVYINADNFDLTVDANFDWVHSQAVRYFFYENQKTRSAQLRIFPEEQAFFLTEAGEWPDQNRIFLLRHYLDALKYLPQQALQELAPADQYLIEMIDGGSPSDYERVITYSAQGAGETDGWYIHLQILPSHADGEGYRGTGEEVVHLFYGDRAGEGAKLWFDFSDKPELLDWDQSREYTAEEFPGVTFRCTPYDISAGDTELISGMPVWSAYLYDLNGDGYPEICAQTSFGSGMIDERIVIHDYSNGITYLLEDRGYHDYYLRKDETDGHLYVDKRVYNSDKLVSSGRLRIDDAAVLLPPGRVVILTAKLLGIEGGSFIVQPTEGSPELSSAGRILVPMENMEPSPEPQIGDILQIEYDGNLMETYPAQIGKVFRISVISQSAPRQINIDGILYLDTGEAISVEVDPSAILGRLHTQVDGRPANHGQGNFACEGYPYARIEGDIAVLIANEWVRFREEVRHSPEYYLTIAREGAVSIEIRAGSRVQVISKDDLSPYEPGESVLLPALTGKDNLRGVTITVRDADNTDIFGVSISASEHGTADSVIECGEWFITPKP